MGSAPIDEGSSWAMGREGASLTSPSTGGPGKAGPWAHAEHPTAEGRMSQSKGTGSSREMHILFCTTHTFNWETAQNLPLCWENPSRMQCAAVLWHPLLLLTFTWRTTCQEETTQTHLKMQRQGTEGGTTAQQLTEAFCYTAGLARSREHLAWAPSTAEAQA